MLSRSFFILSFIFIVLSAPAQIPEYKSYQIQKKLGRTEINTIYQDRSGFIWIGTGKGVFKFDGFEFQEAILDDTLKEQHVTAIYETSDNELWVGYENGHLAILKDGQFNLFKPEEGSPKAPITAILEDIEGRVWFSTYGEGIYYIDNHIYLFDSGDGLTDEYIYTMIIDRQGHIWAGTDYGINICYLQEGRKMVKTLTTQNGLPDNIVLSLHQDHENNIWIGMQSEGICKYDRRTKQFIVPDISQNWQFGAVQDLLAFPENELWMATMGHGIVELQMGEKNQFRQCHHQSIPKNSKINTLLQDNEGNVWFVIDKQELFSCKREIEFIQQINGLGIKNIHALYHDGQQLWYSTNDGLYRFWLDNLGNCHLENIYGHAATGRDLIISIYEDKWGFLWLGTFGNGLMRMDPETGKYTIIREKEGLINDNILSIAGQEDVLWLATLGGVSQCVITNPQDLNSFLTFRNYSSEHGLGSNYIYDVMIDSRGKVWFATDGKGITVLDDDDFINYNKEDGLSSEVIYSITEDNNGNIWFSTLEAGIYRYDGNNFRNFSIAEGLRDLNISSIATDNRGHIVIVHQRGIDVLDPSNGDFFYHSEEDGIIDIDPELNAVTQDHRGHLWLGTQNGIIKYLNIDKSFRRHPQTTISEVMIFLNKENAKGQDNFQYNQNHLSFGYIGLWYHFPENVVYQHKLEGYDIDWHTTKDRLAVYSNLSPGKYTFSIRSSIGGYDFENAEISTYKFVIRSPFWKKAWFILLMGFLTISLIYYYIKAREKRLNKLQKLERDRLEFQFETLKSQVNPHFLFNSFNTLMTTIEDDKERALVYVEKMSDFFRSILQYRKKQVISLKEELTIIQDYFFLQQQRYQENLQMQIDVPEEHLNSFIPPLTLQLLVENAIKHNVISRSKPLLIEIFVEKDFLVIKNILQLKKESEPSTRVGLQNVLKRYELLVNRKVRIQQSDHYYIVHLPIIKQES